MNQTASRVSSKPRCFNSLPSSKSQPLRFGSFLKPSQNPESSVSAEPICSFHRSYMVLGSAGKVRRLSCGFNLRNAMWSVSFVGARSLHSSGAEAVSESSGLARGLNAGSGRSLWEESAERLEKGKAGSGQSSWEESAERLENGKAGSGRSSWEESAERLEKGKAGSGRSSEESAERLEKGSGSSWEESAKRLNKGTGSFSREEPERNHLGRGGRFREDNRGNRNRTSTAENRGRGGRGIVSTGGDRGSRRMEYAGGDRGSRTRVLPVVKDWRKDRSGRVGSTEIEKGSRDRVLPATKDWRRDRIERVESAEEERGSRNRVLRVDNDWRRDRIVRGENNEEESSDIEEMEVIDDTRWDKNRTMYGRMGDVKESTLPLMIGEGVYGVGPVLAALSAGRRQFYELYVQEGLDLKSNNRKKDKKGFQNVLRMAKKMGLNIKSTSKHDLNMIADNRPHQGLLLDASPLNLVNIKELDPVSIEDNGSLWVALDEVTDPQNLGAIVRSAYFFGASGVVVCVKNSAPLSGVVSKASAGSLEVMEIRCCKNMMQFLTSSSQNGWRVLGASVSADSIPLSEVSPGAPTILVLGSEGKGLRFLVEKSCSELVKIHGNIPVEKTAGKESENAETTDMDQRCSSEEFRSFMAVESLNVSVATGVLLHHLIGNKSAHAQ